MTEADGTCEYVLDPDKPETWGGEEGDDCLVREDVLNEDEVWTCPHDAEEGEELCIFHLPVEEKRDGEVVDAFLETVEQAVDSDDKEKRERRLQFIGAKFGEFDLSANPPEVVGDEVGIDLSYIKVEGEADWSGSMFDMRLLNFVGATFSNYANFERSKFENKTIFFRAEFGDEAVFDSAEFGGGVSFRGAEFGGESSFEKVRFRMSPEFRHAKFVDTTNFLSAYFGEGVDFHDAVFASKAKFFESDFVGESNFAEAGFEGGASFYDVEFAGKATFLGTDFGEGASFGGAEFRNEAVFGKVDFRDDVSFMETEFENEAIFVDADFGGYTNFQHTKFRGESVFLLTDFVGVADFWGAEFNADARFKGFAPEYANFEDADLTDADFTDAELHEANFESALLSRATLFGAYLRGAKLAGAVLGDVRINEETQFLGHPSEDDDSSPHTLSAILSRPCCGYDPGYGRGGLFTRLRNLISLSSESDSEEEGDEEDMEVDKAKSVYHALEELGGREARPHLQSQAFVRRQDLQKNDYKDVVTDSDSTLEEKVIAGGRYIKARASRATLLYGESPWRVIAWSLGIILGFALLFPYGGWMKPEGGEPISYSQIPTGEGVAEAVGGFFSILGDSVYYSTLTFTALGFGDFNPVGLGRALTTIETGLGAVLLALLVFILGRRAAR